MPARELPAREALAREGSGALVHRLGTAQQEVAETAAREGFEEARHEVGAVDVVDQPHAVQRARSPAHAGAVAIDDVGAAQDIAIGRVVAGEVQRARVDEEHRVRAAARVAEPGPDACERVLHRAVLDRDAEDLERTVRQTTRSFRPSPGALTSTAMFPGGCWFSYIS